jgi:DNA polymerase I-like protein with 3'-5' exonuclease and polymerase domains
LTGQKNAYPSLNEVAEYYGLPCKLDVVKTEYWEVGLDTDQVPWDILLEYCEHDVWLTEQCARRQMQEYRNCSRQLQTTIRVALDDLHALQEMEWNGFYYNQNRSFEEASVLLERAGEIKQSLGTLTNTAELNINWGSTDQVSAVLYGGTIKRIENETYLFEYKDPRKQPVKRLEKLRSSTNSLELLLQPKVLSLKKKESGQLTKVLYDP